MNKTSEVIQEQAMKMAKSIQRPNQTKEQTKFISQGIEKGIVEYKKQQNKKSRERDKVRKAKLKTITKEPEVIEITKSDRNFLPWALLVISWIGFISFVIYTRST